MMKKSNYNHELKYCWKESLFNVRLSNEKTCKTFLKLNPKKNWNKLQFGLFRQSLVEIRKYFLKISALRIKNFNWISQISIHQRSKMLLILRKYLRLWFMVNESNRKKKLQSYLFSLVIFCISHLTPVPYMNVICVISILAQAKFINVLTKYCIECRIFYSSGSNQPNHLKPF